MSYRKPKKNDSLNNYFSSLVDFVQLAPHLYQATDKKEFQMWLEKLELIDRRSLFRYLQQNKHKIRPEFLALAQRRFIKLPVKLKV